MAQLGLTPSLLVWMICVTLQWNAIQGKNYRYSSGCYTSPVKTLEMKCGPNEMLRIARAFYGYSPSGRCSYSQDDCTFDEHQNYACVGRESCTINMPGGLGRPIPRCKHGQKQSNYFQVEYECVPAQETHNICTTSKLTDQKGYISSPGYPLNYDSVYECQVTIEVSSKQELRLYTVDMNLRELKTGQGCTDHLYIRSDLRSVTICGQRGSEELLDSSNGRMDIRFNATAGGNNKGFWLYYEAHPQIEETTTIQTTTTLKSLISKITQPSGNGENPVLENEMKTDKNTPKLSVTDKQTEPTSPPTSQDEVPFAAIVGGVIGSLCFILTVLLILLLLQRVKERHDLEKKKHLPFLDVRNQAFQSNSELCPQDSNYC